MHLGESPSDANRPVHPCAKNREPACRTGPMCSMTDRSLPPNLTVEPRSSDLQTRQPRDQLLSGLQECVELRGFDSPTPSMRTRFRIGLGGAACRLPAAWDHSEGFSATGTLASDRLREARHVIYLRRVCLDGSGEVRKLIHVGSRPGSQTIFRCFGRVRLPANSWPC
jgi:hypothetical protein